MNLLFLGYAISAERSFQTPGSSPAANKYQLGLLAGLHRRLGDALTVVTRLPIASGRGGRWVRRQAHELFPGLSTTILPMPNLPLLKQIVSAFAAYGEVRRWGSAHRGQRNVLVGYNLNTLLGVAAAFAARAAGARFVFLFTDPPYVNTRKGFIWKPLYAVNAAMVRYTVGRAEGIIAVNEGGARLFAPGKPYCVVEGGVPAEGIAPPEALAETDEKVLVYGGGLSPHNGLENLIDGFLRTDNPHYRLKIYGRGMLEAQLKQRAAADGRIAFPGYISAEEMARVQRHATALVNPRPSGLEICKTTFPSKLMEYLASGRPVLTTRLPGITQDYEPHFFFVEDESPDGFAAAIDGVLNQLEEVLAARGAEGYRFVTEHKNWQTQADRALAFVQSLLQES